ncbi:oligosaccharide flippase family protein [Sphingomonas sp.]|uniref:oligosaccharide flippase family protein n=1 Tax=Sphingomonas sp. TaxID=28214 RepID=UPI003B3BD322
MTISPARLPAAARIKQMMTGGAASIAFHAIVTNMLRIVSSMTLTRLLDAHAYGVVGVVTSVAYVLTMLSEVGLSAFIVRHAEGDDPRFLDQVWSIRLIRGLILCGAMIALAQPAATFLEKPEMALVIAVWSVSFLIEAGSSLAFATAIREQKLWRLSMLDLALNVVTLILSVLIALVWRSYWALICGMIGGALVKAVLSYTLFPQSRRRWTFSAPRSKEMWSFSRYIAMSSLLTLLVMQSDKIVLARLMPLTVYGLYAIATTLNLAPATLAYNYANRVLYPIYARVARDEPGSLRRVFYDRRRKVVCLYMFAVGGLIGGAPLLVEMLYDDRYRDVSIYLRLLAISTMLMMPSYVANQVLMALGHTKSMLVSNIFRIVWLVVGGAIGLVTGDVMLLVAVVGTVELPGLLCFLFNLRRVGLLSIREEAYGFAAGALGGAIGWGLWEAALLLFGPF